MTQETKRHPFGKWLMSYTPITTTNGSIDLSISLLPSEEEDEEVFPRFQTFIQWIN